jgi:hypothetical protein
MDATTVEIGIEKHTLLELLPRSPLMSRLRIEVIERNRRICYKPATKSWRERRRGLRVQVLGGKAIKRGQTGKPKRGKRRARKRRMRLARSERGMKL